jgi:ABC-type Fe3+/spermidine/putrescine transport system ATPase subunit
MLILTEIKKNYNRRTVLDIDRMDFEKGKIYAVLGPNGSGKSTMLKIIAGIEQPNSGKIDYDGRTSDV